MVKGFHIADGQIVTSDGEVGHQPQFLIDQAEDINCFYHLNYNVACLLKLMGITKDQGRGLLRGWFTIGDFKLCYRPGKYFAISKGDRFAAFSDAYQYHAEELWRQFPDTEHHALARRAKEIGGEVLAALRSVGLNPKTLTSPISAYQKEVLNKMNLPTVSDLPEQAGLYAYNCVKGNLLEAYQIGHFNQVYDYDIISAYPSEIAKLLDIRKGKWKHTDAYQPEATYGFCRAIVNITSPISPLIYTKGKDANRDNYTTTGEWEDYLTKAQIDFIRQYNLGTVGILDGWWWRVDFRSTPYARIVEEMYQHKERATGLRRTVIKRIPNGIYGKMLEKQDGVPGELFNPVYGAIIETNTEIKVIKFCLDNDIDPIHIAVDGVLAGRQAKEPLYDELGGWKKTNQGACFVMGAGAVALKDKKGKGDFSLDYAWVADQIIKHPKDTVYTMTKPAPVTLPIALRGNWSALGTLRNIKRSVDIGFEEKRWFVNLPQKGQDLYDHTYTSEPLDVVQVMY